MVGIKHIPTTGMDNSKLMSQLFLQLLRVNTILYFIKIVLTYELS